LTSSVERRLALAPQGYHQPPEKHQIVFFIFLVWTGARWNLTTCGTNQRSRQQEFAPTCAPQGQMTFFDMGFVKPKRDFPTLRSQIILINSSFGESSCVKMDHASNSNARAKDLSLPIMSRNYSNEAGSINQIEPNKLIQFIKPTNRFL